MAKQPILPVRVDADTKARWTAAAEQRNVSVAELIRAAVEAWIAAPAPAESQFPRPRMQEVGGKRTYTPDPKS